jgi:hypothetical protein
MIAQALVSGRGPMGNGKRTSKHNAVTHGILADFWVTRGFVETLIHEEVIPIEDRPRRKVILHLDI